MWPWGPGGAEAEVRRRVAELEHLFGDPADPANPLGSARFLAADTRREPLAAAEQLLDRFGLNAEFVPRALGGRLDQLDTLARVVRAVFRHDAALGLGHGITNFLAAVVLWAAGTPAQQTAAARLLLGGGALAAAYPELASGSDFLSNGFTATATATATATTATATAAAAGHGTDADADGDGDGDGHGTDGDGTDGTGVFLLSGRKEAFNNASRAGALVLFARTGHGRHSHSVLLVRPAALPAERIHALPRHRTLGVRGCLVTGIAFDDCPVPAGALVGERGQGLELALKVFPVIRAVGPSTALGCADTALRTAVACVLDRTGPPAADLSAAVPSAADLSAAVPSAADLSAADLPAAPPAADLSAADLPAAPPAADLPAAGPSAAVPSAADLPAAGPSAAVPPAAAVPSAAGPSAAVPSAAVPPAAAGPSAADLPAAPPAAVPAAGPPAAPPAADLSAAVPSAGPPADLSAAVPSAAGPAVVRADGDPGGVPRASHARATLAGAFVDLLLCDCLALVATRAVHLVPADSGLYAAASKYLLPQLLTETSYELSTLLGAQFHTGSGAYGAFRKNVRDLPMIGLGAAGTAACRATVVPQLPRLARDCWLTPAAAPPPAALFALDAGGLPPLDLARLTPAATADPLMASLTHPAPPPGRPEPREVTELGGRLLAELARLRDGCAALDAGGRPALADPRAHALADRYALVLAGAACLGVWRAQQPRPGAFLASAGWLVAALTRLLRRLGGPAPGPDTHQDGQDGPLLAEVLARYRTRRSFDLYDTPLHGTPPAGAPLHDAPPAGAPLHGAPLHGAPLYDAPLYGAPLYGAPLYDAPLHDAPLHGTPPAGAPATPAEEGNRR
nr:hypothetical protein [Kitasatospora sp. MAP5-34]